MLVLTRFEEQNQHKNERKEPKKSQLAAATECSMETWDVVLLPEYNHTKNCQDTTKNYQDTTIPRIVRIQPRIAGIQPRIARIQPRIARIQPYQELSVLPVSVFIVMLHSAPFTLHISNFTINTAHHTSLP